MIVKSLKCDACNKISDILNGDEIGEPGWIRFCKVDDVAISIINHIIYKKVFGDLSFCSEKCLVEYIRNIKATDITK